MSLPRQLRTQTGRSIVLANELGKGGEGVVYEVHGNDHVAAKIYHRDKAADRSEKIEAIVGAEWHKVSGSVAFPIDALLCSDRPVCRVYYGPGCGQQANPRLVFSYEPEDSIPQR